MIYSHVRVSSTTQNIGRQTKEMQKLILQLKMYIMTNRVGKNFNRENYQILMDKIKKVTY